MSPKTDMARLKCEPLRTRPMGHRSWINARLFAACPIILLNPSPTSLAKKGKDAK